MPFQDGVYYPFVPSGPHPSPAVPALISSAPSVTLSSAKSAAVPFRFHPKLERVDWRRISAVDIGHVVNNLDVDTLQELIGSVTYCNLDGELCQRCRSPVDPALVKLLQLAQLTVEWLLHCQEFLTLSLRAAEEQLDKSGKDREELQAAHGRENNLLLSQMKKQEERMKEMTAELRQRKKIICNQQSMLASSSRLVIQKCHHCEKSFHNVSFLQSHVRRRHPAEYSKHKLVEEVHPDNEVMENLKKEISCLKEQVAQQQHALQAKVAQEKEQQTVQRDLQKEVDRFRAEEMARMERKIEDSRDGIRREMELLCTRNIQAMSDLNQSQLVNHEEVKLKKQERKWKSRLNELKVLYEAEKTQLLNELSRVQSAESELKENAEQLKLEMVVKLQEKDEIIKVQLEQIKKLSNTKEVQVPELISVPQKLIEKNGRPVSPMKLRQELEESVLKRLENFGVKHPSRGITRVEFRSILARQQSKWSSFPKEEPVGAEEDPPPEPQSRSTGLTQVLPQPASLPPHPAQQFSPLHASPGIQTGLQPNMKTRVFTNRIPPFSSDSESEDKYLNMEVNYPKQEKETGADVGSVKLPSCQNFRMRTPPCPRSSSSLQHHLTSVVGTDESDDEKYEDEDTDEEGEEEDKPDDEITEDSSDISRDTDSVQLNYVEDLTQSKLGRASRLKSDHSLDDVKHV